MSIPTKPVEQKARELLDQFERAVRVNEVFHIAGKSEATIEVVLSMNRVNERRDALLAALNTDGERIRREGECRRTLLLIEEYFGNTPPWRQFLSRHPYVTETLEDLSTPSKGVG